MPLMVLPVESAATKMPLRALPEEVLPVMVVRTAEQVTIAAHKGRGDTSGQFSSIVANAGHGVL